MPNSKMKTDQDPKKTSISSKLAKMAAATLEANEEFSMSMLTMELEKQCEYLKEDMSALIKSSLAPIQLSIESFQETVDAFGKRLTSVETTVGENFEALAKAEADIAALKATNEELLEHTAHWRPNPEMVSLQDPLSSAFIDSRRRNELCTGPGNTNCSTEGKRSDFTPT